MSDLRGSNGPIPSLDGIRALSVALVFFSHNGLGHIVPGGLGVTIFFVLSGYLITTLMRIEYAERRAVSFGAFYLRRFLRLIPPLVVIVAISVALSVLAGVGEPFTSGGLLSVLFYYSNYYLISHGPMVQPPGMGVTWSLAVEEHYYLLFPPLALALLRARRPIVPAVTLAALCVAILGWRCWLVRHGASEDYIGMATDTRIDAILVGCLLAMIRNPWLEPVAPAKRARDLAFALGCLAILAVTLAWRDELFRLTGRYSLQSLSIAGLLYVAIARADVAPFRWLNCRPLVYIGTVSYTFYLAHYMVLLWAEQTLSFLGAVAVAAITAAVTLAIAALMQHFVEKPFAALRRRLHQHAAQVPARSTAAVPREYNT